MIVLQVTSETKDNDFQVSHIDRKILDILYGIAIDDSIIISPYLINFVPDDFHVDETDISKSIYSRILGIYEMFGEVNLATFLAAIMFDKNPHTDSVINAYKDGDGDYTIDWIKIKVQDLICQKNMLDF